MALNDVLPRLRKGTLIAQDPARYEDPELEEDERDAIGTEVLQKWKLPMALYIAITMCFIGAAVQ